MSFIAHAAAALAADVRSFSDDISQGFVLGGIVGAFVVVRQKARLSASRQTLVVSRWALAGAIVFPPAMLVLDWAFK